MPIRAISSTGSSLHSFEFDQTGWAQLKAGYRELGLRMPCCAAPAIPKTSSKGTRFFAHASRGECTSAPESDEHLRLKQLIAGAAKGVGWEVTTERPGKTPNGEDWVADVHCQLDSVQVVFEAQVSLQTDEELRHRQARYKDSGVRSAWFYSSKLRDRQFAHDQDLPAFALSPVEIGKVPHILGFDVPLPEFVEGMLTKRLRWTIPERDEPVHVEVMSDVCWKCGKSVRQVFGHIEGLQISEEPPEEWIERYFTVAQLSKALEAVQQLVSNEELKAQGLNTVMESSRIRGKPTNWPHCNRCLHCGAPQNNHHVGEKLKSRYYSLDDRIGIDLVPFSRIKKGHGRWVFDAEHPQTLDSHSEAN